MIKELLPWRCQTYTGVFFRLGIGPGVSVNRCLIEKGSHSSVSWKKKDSRWMSNYFTSLIIFMKSWQHETLVYIVNPPFHQSKSRQIDHDTGVYVHDDCHVMAVGMLYDLFYVPFKLMYKDEGNKANSLTLLSLTTRLSGQTQGFHDSWHDLLVVPWAAGFYSRPLAQPTGTLLNEV